MAFQIKAMNQTHLMCGTSNKTLSLIMSQFAAIYDTVKLAKLRFYIATQPKPHSDEDASAYDSEEKCDDLILQGQNEIIELSGSQSLSLVSSCSAEDQVSRPHPGTTDGSTATNHSVNTDFPVL
ncbi:unnamed protein product [Arctogadus glacialis]